MKKTLLALGILTFSSPVIAEQGNLEGEVYEYQAWSTLTVTFSNHKVYRAATVNEDFTFHIDVFEGCERYYAGMYAQDLTPSTVNATIDLPVMARVDRGQVYSAQGRVYLEIGQTTKFFNFVPSNSYEFIEDLKTGNSLRVKVSDFNPEVFPLNGSKSAIDKAVDLCEQNLSDDNNGFFSVPKPQNSNGGEYFL